MLYFFPFMLNPEAASLNKIIKNKSKAVYQLLSQRGLAIFFPKTGILSQSAQAKNAEINATIGIAKADDKSPLRLSLIAQKMLLPPQEVFPYAPGTGLLKLRQAWQQQIGMKNKGINVNQISLPVVTVGVTQGVYLSAYLFINEGDSVILPDLYWENYDLIFRTVSAALLKTFPTFKNNLFNVSALEKLLFTKGRKKIVLLNFPNNPSGFTPSEDEVEKISKVFLKAAGEGKQILALIDDAYFGLVYEKGVSTFSLFSKIYNLHPNILAIKLDGATKEDFVWGFRVGFITFAVKGADASLYTALSEKVAGVIRATVSNAPLLSQSLLLNAYQSPKYLQEKKTNFLILKKRYLKVKEIFATNKYKDQFTPYPFNSGYFLCLKLKKNAEKVRQLLLEKYHVGVIAFSNNNLRISYSSVAEKDLPRLFKLIYQACQKA